MHYNTFSPILVLNFYLPSDAPIQERSRSLTAAIRQLTGLNTNACATLCTEASSDQLKLLTKSRIYDLKTDTIDQSQPVEESHNAFVIADCLLTPVDGEFSPLPGKLTEIQYEFFDVASDSKARQYDVVITINHSECRKVLISHGVQSGSGGFRLKDGEEILRKRFPDALQAAGIVLSNLPVTQSQLIHAVQHLIPNFSLKSIRLGGNRPWSQSKKLDVFYRLAKQLSDKRARSDKHGIAFVKDGVVKFIFLDTTAAKTANLGEPAKAPQLVFGIAKAPKDLTADELSAFLGNTKTVYRKKITHEIVVSLTSRDAKFCAELKDNARNLRDGHLQIVLDAPFTKKPDDKYSKKPDAKYIKSGIRCIEPTFSIGKFELMPQTEMRRKMLRDSLDWQKQKKVHGKLKHAA